LPAYARPLFIRVAPALAATDTFKTAIGQLAEEGFDPSRIGDPLYIDDPALGAYAPLDPQLFARVARGELKL